MDSALSIIGKPFKRIEDLPLLQGRGRFVDDLQFPGMLHAAFVRSPHAHALIRGIDTGAARHAPGVQAVLTLADLMPLLSEERLPLQFRTAALPPDITPFVLAKDEVAFVGEAVAVVIAAVSRAGRGRSRAGRGRLRAAAGGGGLPRGDRARRAARPSRPQEQRDDRDQAVLRRRCRGVRARAAQGRGQPQAASRRRAFDRGPRRARELRRQRGPADAVDLDPARARGARLPDASAPPRREPDPGGGARRRRRLRRQVRDVSRGGGGRRRRSASCAGR